MAANNSGLAQVAFQCSADTFAVNQTLELLYTDNQQVIHFFNKTEPGK